MGIGVYTATLSIAPADPARKQRSIAGEIASEMRLLKNIERPSTVTPALAKTDTMRRISDSLPSTCDSDQLCVNSRVLSHYYIQGRRQHQAESYLGIVVLFVVVVLIVVILFVVVVPIVVLFSAPLAP